MTRAVLHAACGLALAKSPSRKRLTLLWFLVVALWGSSVRAALDPGLAQPYRIQVVLYFHDHRLLTSVFKDQVERELRDGLRSAFGSLAAVEVVRQHPKLEGVEEKGLGAILDGWKDINDTKTHFILIDFVNGHYELTARQHDGYTGQASPMLRRERTSDREFVARTAALLINRDLGLVGTVVDRGDQVVRVALKGAALKTPLTRWVKKGEVFAIAQVRQSAGGLKGFRVPWALLQVQEGPDDAGILTCRLYHRHPNPLDEGPGVLGIRCIKLDTLRGPLRIRLMDATAKVPTPKPNQQVHVRRFGFTGEDGMRVEGATDADGYFSTERAADRGVFDHVAFVSVLSDNQVRAQVPIPIHDDRPVAIAVSITQEAGLQLTVRRDLWERQIYEGLLVLADQFKDVEKLLAKEGQKQTALAEAETAANRLRDDLIRFAQQREKLLEEAKQLKVEAKLNLSNGDQRLKELQVGRDKLQTFIVGLRRVLAEENDPKRKEAKEKLARAELLESEANYDQALELYKEVIDSKLFNDPELTKRYESLTQAWKPKNDRHARARDFIYKIWPSLEPSKLSGSLREVRDALETCKTNGDAMTPRKFLFATIGQVAKLNQQLAALDPDNNDDDRNVAERIVELTEELNKLAREVGDFLDKSGK